MFNIYDIFFCITAPIGVFITARFIDFYGLIGQLPGVESVVQTAAQTNRWEAVALAVIMLSVTGFLVYIVKKLMDQALEREKQQTKRIDELENYIRTTLMDVVKEHTKVMAALITSSETSMNISRELVQALHSTRPCFMSGDTQTKMLADLGNKIVDHIKLSNFTK